MYYWKGGELAKKNKRKENEKGRGTRRRNRLLENVNRKEKNKRLQESLKIKNRL